MTKTARALVIGLFVGVALALSGAPAGSSDQLREFIDHNSPCPLNCPIGAPVCCYYAPPIPE